MDVLKILKESGKDLYSEDLEFFETELDTGNYDQVYVAKCRKELDLIKRWQSCRKEEKADDRAGAKSQGSKGVIMGIGDVAPKGVNPVASGLDEKQLIFNDIQSLRKDSSYKKRFREYVFKKDDIDEKFIDENYSFFEPWEMSEIISVKPLEEWFLEKYFDTLDPDKIARYQKFSESFFMKHFSELDPNVVLKFGKNEWRQKAKRSKQLDVFLRLKGVNK